MQTILRWMFKLLISELSKKWKVQVQRNELQVLHSAQVPKSIFHGGSLLIQNCTCSLGQRNPYVLSCFPPSKSTPHPASYFCFNETGKHLLMKLRGCSSCWDGPHWGTECCLYRSTALGLCCFTVTGSSSGFSISAWRRKTFPRHTRHSIRSNVGMRSRLITPATNLQGDSTASGAAPQPPQSLPPSTPWQLGVGITPTSIKTLF